MITKENTIILSPMHEEVKNYFLNNDHNHIRAAGRAFIELVKFDTKDKKAALLDLGCKTNSMQQFFQNLGYSWFGVDIEPLAGNVVRGDMHKIPYMDDLFVVTFCCHAFEHSDNPLLALKEMARVTQTGGILFIVTPAYSKYQIFKCDKTHILVPTADQMVRFCEVLGLKPIMVSYFKEAEDEPDRFANLITIAEVVRK